MHHVLIAFRIANLLDPVFLCEVQDHCINQQQHFDECYTHSQSESPLSQPEHKIQSYPFDVCDRTCTHQHTRH